MAGRRSHNEGEEEETDVSETRATQQQLAEGRGIPKYLEPPNNNQNNLHHGIRKTQQRDRQYDSSSVPRFGEWDEKDHVSAQGYTRAFERITDQKNMPGGGYVQSPYRATPKQTPQAHESMGWCFFWRRKYK